MSVDDFGERSFPTVTKEMLEAGYRVMQHGLATPKDIWDAMYRAAMGEPVDSIKPKDKP